MPEAFDRILSDDRQIFFLNGGRVTILNVTGEERYEGELSDIPVAACMAGRRSLILNTGAELLHITYK